MPGEETTPPKHCPLLKQNCIEERCEWWTTINVTQPGKLAGSFQSVELHACIFHCLLYVAMHPPLTQVFGPRG
jgi:hypothetical protein